MAEDAAATAQSDMTPQPPSNPDAQVTVSDFTDYTEYFPSDLVRSLTLIAKLDADYHVDTQAIHELTKTYGNLPHLPADQRPDPQTLRKNIAQALDHAIYCRDSTFAEASRIYEVAERHCHRLSIIKRKLQALPQPPSRDPTPVPASPQTSRALQRPYDRIPRINFNADTVRPPNAAPRARDRSRKSTIPLPKGRTPIRTQTPSDTSDESDVGSNIELATGSGKVNRLKTGKPKTPKSARVRPPGVMGTNVHSQVAGISTSNALAQLSPPPADAKPGSVYAPWLKLTAYEMAVLRKQMKKNAIWNPSDTMIRRELQRKGRGREAYEKEKARCEATGEPFLNEDGDDPTVKRIQQTVTVAAAVSAAPPATTGNPPALPAVPAVPATVEDMQMSAIPVTPVAPVAAVVSDAGDAVAVTLATPPGQPAQAEPTVPEPLPKEDTSIVNKGMKLNEAKKLKREAMLREQASRDAESLEAATQRLKEAGNMMKNIFANTRDTVAVTPLRREPTRPARKRRRESQREPTPPAPTENATAESRASSASQDNGTKTPAPKRIRINPPNTVPAPAVSTPVPVPNSAAAVAPVVAPPTPQITTPVPLPPDPIKTTSSTVQVPLAPAGPSTPPAVKPPTVKPPSVKAVSPRASPALPSPTENKKPQATGPLPPIPTAASSRPRRESLAPKAPSSPPQQPVKAKTPTPAPEPLPSTGPTTRPRSARGHVPAPKAASAEPPLGSRSRELRRASNVSLPVQPQALPTRASSRRKPPPSGDVTAGEDGKNKVTVVKRSQGSKNKRKKTGDETHEPLEEIDPNEPRYCICDDVSFGTMISCDNQCEKEWFHLECVGLKEIPPRRQKWYCPECRIALNVDTSGNRLPAAAAATAGAKRSR